MKLAYVFDLQLPSNPDDTILEAGMTQDLKAIYELEKLRALCEEFGDLFLGYITFTI